MNRRIFNYSLMVCVSLCAVLVVACRYDDGDTGVAADVVEANVSECMAVGTRAAYDVESTHTMLTVWRGDDGLECRLANYWMNCGHGKVTVACRWEDGTLAIGVDDGIREGDQATSCMCPYNIDFTVAGIDAPRLGVVLDGKNLGEILLAAGGGVSIDIETLEQTPVDAAATRQMAVGEVRRVDLTDYAEATTAAQRTPRFGATDGAGRVSFRCEWLPVSAAAVSVRAEMQGDVLTLTLSAGADAWAGARQGSVYGDVMGVARSVRRVRLVVEERAADGHAATRVAYDGTPTDEAVLRLNP